VRTCAVILAGGDGSRLGPLTAKRSKPAVPFAGRYRIIDFPRSNCVNSGIFHITILAQNCPHLLIEHIGNGEPWDLNRDFTGKVRVLTPYKGRDSLVWYQGTANAVFQNMQFFKDVRPDLVLILSGDHVYKMDYTAMVAFHLERKADVTISTMRVPAVEASRYGFVEIDEEHRITSFVEKPVKTRSNLASMGIYLFNPQVLEKVLWQDSQCIHSSHDFGKDILPRIVSERARIYAYPYSGYWMDVGTIPAYWQAHIDILSNPTAIDLNDPTWIFRTRKIERSPARIASGARIGDSMISDGCVIDPGAVIERSVLSPGVRVMSGATVRESVILEDTVIGSIAFIHRAIIDRKVRIGDKVYLGADNPIGDLRISVVGENSSIPAHTVLNSGTVIDEEDTRKDNSFVSKPSNVSTQRERIPYGRGWQKDVACSIIQSSSRIPEGDGHVRPN